MEKNNGISKGRLWTSYILQGIVAAMLLMGAANNILQTEMAVTGAVDMGYPKSSVLYLGIVLLISTLLYLYPKTNILGAILLTGWLGGAVATHIIHKDALGMVLMPVIFGVVLWLALWLRDNRYAILLPLGK